jgi:hypothetical protein
MRKSSYIKLKTNFHIFRENDKLNLQNNFIFVDTETKRIGKEEQFYLGWLLYWDRSKNIKHYVFLKDKKMFYDYCLTLMKELDHLFIFAHNTDFDIKVLGGISLFIKDGFVVDSFYINGGLFIIRLKKKNKVIEILDSMNYIPMSLKKIGESMGLNKIDIDFNKCTDLELSNYCKNDVEILFLFIKKLLLFLESYNLSKLKPTVSSLALNIFRHKFYSKKNNPIYIHGWEKAIELERLSYRGGISDCFRVGEHFKDKLFKLDINSMYPYIMKNYKCPTKLIYYRDITSCKSSLLLKIFNKYFDSKLIIARCKINLPKQYAYILVKTEIDKQNKSMFLSGTFIVSLTTPELQFVKKYGKIIEIYNLALYESSIIFDKFVDFFYEKRKEFDKNNNKAYKMFCKYILNSLYGKFGQLQTSYYEYTSKKENYSSKLIIDTINERNYLEMSLGNKIFEVEDSGKNSFDSFVAISSFITAYARMYLIELIILAKRENVYYVDTDCLIVNLIGYNNLFNFINKDVLGKLKLEEESNDTTIYRPKYYIFNNIEKCKGIKKSAKRLFENDKKLIIEQEQFTRFKTSLRKNEFNKQTVNNIIKEINKTYDKGIITKDGYIEPYIIGE